MILAPKPGWATDVKIKAISPHSPMYIVVDGYVHTGKSFNNTIYMCPFIYEMEDADEVFWHEYRHVMHQREGLFSFYYTSKFRDVKEFIQTKPIEWINKCLEVENDCDEYAAFKTGKPIAEPYPADGVWLYDYAIKQLKKCVRRGTVSEEDAFDYLKGLI